jgi:hypothetical protein
MVQSHPEIMQVLRHRGLGYIQSDQGLTLRALQDLERGIASGRFTLADPTVALCAMGGSVLALLELQFARPDLDGDESAASMAEMVLRMLGVPLQEAHDIAMGPCRQRANGPYG